MNIDVNSPKIFNFQRRETTREERIELVRDIDPDGYYPSGPPSDWVVDDEREIKFAQLGGRGYMPEGTDYVPSFHILIIEGRVIRFEVRYISVSIKEGCSVRYAISRASAPLQFKDRDGILRQAYAEGIFAEDYSRTFEYRPRDWIVSIEVNDFEFNFF